MRLFLKSYAALLSVSKLYESTGRESYQGTHFQITFVLAGGWCWSSKYCREVEAAQALHSASSKHMSNLNSKSEGHCSRDKCVFHANADRNPVVGNSMSFSNYSSICSISLLNPYTLTGTLFQMGDRGTGSPWFVWTVWTICTKTGNELDLQSSRVRLSS